ncbi:MAG: MFS transporter [Oscillospiraceae bacterium]|nr:MFS transporter [Oscillospiraceae bacterium]
MQAVNVNLLAIIFIPLREQFGLTYAQFGTLVFVNFITQLLVSIVFSKVIDKIGMKPFIMPALFVCMGGLVLFALTPLLFAANVYMGFMLSIFIYAGGGGLMELCLSPIVDAIPSDAIDSSKALSFLHSFYAWGQAGVVLVTTGLLYFGLPWRAIVIMWIVVPALDAVMFARAPIAERATGDKAMPIRSLFGMRIFVLALVAIACGGAAETVIAQYASSFLERGLGLSKMTGDILGLCGFAIFLGIGRLLYGILGDRMNIHNVLIGGSVLALAAYFVIVFTPVGTPAPSVAAIALCGLFVSLMWPGTLAIASKGLPLAGVSMFALLAASGSFGCSIGPWVGGVVTDFSMRFLPQGIALSAEQFGLRAGLMAGAVFPLASLVTQFALKKSAAAVAAMQLLVNKFEGE